MPLGNCDKQVYQPDITPKKYLRGPPMMVLQYPSQRPGIAEFNIRTGKRTLVQFAPLLANTDEKGINNSNTPPAKVLRAAGRQTYSLGYAPWARRMLIRQDYKTGMQHRRVLEEERGRYQFFAGGIHSPNSLGLSLFFLRAETMLPRSPVWNNSITNLR